jgi:phospholipid/cholesterol/gamma-HCH transport system substrate-binding protein
MKKLSVNKGVIVGIFIFIGIVIFVAGVFTIGSQRKTFGNSISIKVIFGNVGGLQEGNNVWLSGVKIGTVKTISFRGGTDVEIVMFIDQEARPHITKDAVAKISSDGFIGNRIVEIFGGTAKAPVIADGDYLQSGKAAGTEDLISTLQENNKNLLEITGDFKAITRKIREGKGTIGELINNPSVAENLRAAIIHFNKASVNTEQAVARLNDYIFRLNSKGTLVNELITDTIAYHDFRETLAQLKNASYSISAFADSLNQAGSALHRTDNPAGAILNDRQMAVDLKSITRNLDSSSLKLDEDLKALQSNFLFRPYFKQKEKQQKKEAQKKKEEQNSQLP